MNTLQKPTVFLARDSYRQRRLRDAARVLPVAGAILISLPLMWPGSGEERFVLSDVLIYVFVLWTVLILVALFLARAIKPDPEAGAGEEVASSVDKPSGPVDTGSD